MRWEPDVPLAGLVRYRIGGATPRLGRPADRGELDEALRAVADAGHRTLGWGANVLVADRGVSEPVLILGDGFDWIRTGSDWIEAGGRCGLPALVGEARRRGRSGWEFLEAVPGSVGGGLRMNAGSAETGLWDRVEWAEAVRPDTGTVRMGPAEAAPAYRRVGVPDAWVFTAARFRAPAGAPEAVEQAHRARRRSKVETQVYELPSCGSVWKNPGPPWGAAWRLVEHVGMRGARRGGARITEKHANFIANEGNATAGDVLWLMRETRRRVREATGIALEPEIQLWGFTPDELEDVGVPTAGRSAA